MPWSPDDAIKHTKQAHTRAQRKLWSRVANMSYKKHHDEARAIREANATLQERTQ